jgi:hypothetical protein
LNIFNIRSKGCDSFEIFEQWLTRYCNSSDLSLSLPRKLLKNNSTKFVKYLGGIEMSEHTFVDETLDLMLKSHSPYSVDDKIKLMKFLQDLSAETV